MDTFGQFIYIQREKHLDSVEDMKNYTRDKDLTLLMNGGSLIFYWKGCLRFLPFIVHMNKNFLAIILSLKFVNNIMGVRVTTDTSIEKAMNVIMGDELFFKFKECGSR